MNSLIEDVNTSEAEHDFVKNKKEEAREGFVKAVGALSAAGKQLGRDIAATYPTDEVAGAQAAAAALTAVTAMLANGGLASRFAPAAALGAGSDSLADALEDAQQRAERAEREAQLERVELREEIADLEAKLNEASLLNERIKRDVDKAEADARKAERELATLKALPPVNPDTVKDLEKQARKVSNLETQLTQVKGQLAQAEADRDNAQMIAKIVTDAFPKTPGQSEDQYRSNLTGTLKNCAEWKKHGTWIADKIADLSSTPRGNEAPIRFILRVLNAAPTSTPATPTTTPPPAAAPAAVPTAPVTPAATPATAPTTPVATQPATPTPGPGTSSAPSANSGTSKRRFQLPGTGTKEGGNKR